MRRRLCASAWMTAIFPGLLLTPSAQAARDAGHYVQVISTVRALPGPGCSSIGSGIGLGDGLYLTAGHVLLDRDDLTGACRIEKTAAAKLDRNGDIFRTEVTDDTGVPRLAKVIVRGTRSAGQTMNFKASGDYAILRVGAPVRAAPRLDPCPGAPRAGQRVSIVVPSGAVSTTVARTQTPKTGDDAAYVDLDGAFPNGSSGAGVLDASSGCLLGLISHRFPEPNPMVTRITPVSLFSEGWMRERGD